jgi:hypothetical protein
MGLDMVQLEAYWKKQGLFIGYVKSSRASAPSGAFISHHGDDEMMIADIATRLAALTVQW